MSSPGAGEEFDGSLKGALLVASPKLGDPNFDRSVVILLDHGDEGALGLVLNRPTAVPVDEILEPWQAQATMAPPGVVFSGGPVSRDAVIGVARARGSVLGSYEPGAIWRPVLGHMGTVDLSVPPGDQPFALAGVRLFSGYAGWDGAQLEAEIAQGAWFVVGALADDLLCTRPADLWHDVLRRQPVPLSMLASYPPHSSVN